MERRLEFIEFRLFWDGGVNRSDIIDMFDVSMPQASKDLTLYQERAPQNAVYDKSAKRYVASDRFEPCFLEPDPSRYLSQLRSVWNGRLHRSDAWIRQFPTFDAVPSPVRGVRTEILRSIISAIRRSVAVEVRYQSLSPVEPRWRWLAPHAIGFDGFRWHARAFCDTDRTFKDFCRRASLRRVKRDQTRSRQVQTGIGINLSLSKIGPHPDLSETQRKVIALDYDMHGGKTLIRVRKALLYYALRRLGLDTDPSARRPQDQQIILLNRAHIDHLLGSSESALGV